MRNKMTKMERKILDRDFKADKRVVGAAIFGRKNKIIESGNHIFFVKCDKHGEISDVKQIDRPNFDSSGNGNSGSYKDYKDKYDFINKFK